MQICKPPQLKEAFLNLVSHRLREESQCRFIGFGVSRHGLYADGQVLDMPISEEAVLGVAVGLSRAGAEVFVDLMFETFACRAWDVLANQMGLSLMRAAPCAPLTIRMLTGPFAGAGLQHDSSIYALLSRLPHVLVAMPAMADDVEIAYNVARQKCHPLILLFSEPLISNYIERQVASDVMRIGRGKKLAVLCLPSHMQFVADAISAINVWQSVTMLTSLFINPLPLAAFVQAASKCESIMLVEGPPPATIFDQLAIHMVVGHVIKVSTYQLWDSDTVASTDDNTIVQRLAKRIRQEVV